MIYTRMGILPDPRERAVDVVVFFVLPFLF